MEITAAVDTVPDPAPVAIVGMACRFPGELNSPAEYWDFLLAGGNAIREIPADRWQGYVAAGPRQATAVRAAVALGGYLERIDGFDAEFFGITPREAELMDPQQRVTLEVCWEALEHAGIDPTTLLGGDTGVFMGACTDDYGRRLLENLPRLQAWMGIGSSLCGVSNRVSYALDLRGPSVTVDTACSAGLVAVHQACQSLRLGETSFALAGGVMLVASPGYPLVLRAAGALAPDGQSKAFDATGDGYGRGEGCGVLALKLLDAAQRDGDRVLAVIRGSAVGQEGRTNGIMAPSRRAQADLLRRAYRNAGVPPHTVGYVEAHGTGTPVGDRTEAGALSDVLGAGRSADRPCLVGSAKRNIGHLEAASGIASVIKAAMALSTGLIPATSLPTGPRADIDWDAAGLCVAAVNTPWPAADHPRRAGVANYGYGGTIAHVVLEQAPEQLAPRPRPAEGAAIYLLSGSSSAQVRANATNLADWLAEHDSVPLVAVARTLACHRAPLAARSFVIAADRDELRSRLRQLADGTAGPGTGGDRPGGPIDQDAVWVFSGHGQQWLGMGRELVATEPELGAVLDELAPVYQAELGFHPREYLENGGMHDVAEIQAMIFAIQIGLARIWTRRGLTPAAVIGHSVGEIAAAVVAGMLDLPDAALLICRRSALLREASGVGTMAMVDLSFDDTSAWLADIPEVVAAIASSPHSTVVSGATASVERVVRQWQAQGIEVRPINSDVAFHSPAMDSLLTRLEVGVRTIRPRPPAVPAYSTALADPRAEVPRDASYWATNLRAPVRLHQAIAAAVADGHRAFLEVSAHPVVAHSIIETLAELGRADGIVQHTLRRDRPELPTLLENLGHLHCAGVRVDRSDWYAGVPFADLPTMGWQHQRYWVDDVTSGGDVGDGVHGHTLLGERTVIQGVADTVLWRLRLDETNRPYPGSHAVLGSEIVPAAVAMNSFLLAGGSDCVTDISLRVPIAVTPARDVQVVSQNDQLVISSRLADDDNDHSWLPHASATRAVLPMHAGTMHEPDGPCVPVDPATVTRLLAKIGVDGFGFQWRIESLATSVDTVHATVTSGPAPTQSSWSTLFDAALSSAPIVFPGDPLLRMPGLCASLEVHAAPPTTALVRVLRRASTADWVDVDIDIADTNRVVLARLIGVRFVVVPRERPAEGDQTEVERMEVVARSGEDPHQFMIGLVREVAGDEMRMHPSRVPVDVPLAQLGADSLISVSLGARLERRLGVPVPASLLWNRPTITAISDYLCERVQRPNRRYRAKAPSQDSI
ncbi:MAG TPA: beta-ketoacyl synthase N-terminal-like domain-containing protein [Pseudonocardiaceae bacterium]|jgi:6-methylsalicylic acid synthase